MTGEEMRDLRKSAGLSAKELASLLGYRSQRWSSFEQGHVPIPPAVEYGARWICENRLRDTDPSQTLTEKAVAILRDALNNRGGSHEQEADAPHSPA